jgi:hypothetical protein
VCRRRRELHDALRASGYSLEFALRSDNNGTLQGLVAAGFGKSATASSLEAAVDPRCDSNEGGRRGVNRSERGQVLVKWRWLRAASFDHRDWLAGW